MDEIIQVLFETLLTIGIVAILFVAFEWIARFLVQIDDWWHNRKKPPEHITLVIEEKKLSKIWKYQVRIVGKFDKTFEVECKDLYENPTEQALDELLDFIDDGVIYSMDSELIE